MKAPPFDYHRPQSLPEALELLRGADARVLAGGQSLVPMLNFRLLAPTALVDINGLEELRGISIEGGRLSFGAMARQREIERHAGLAQIAPIFAQAVREIGHRQTRNRGTIGGSLCHLDPSAELPMLCLLHDATLTIQSAGGMRRVAVRDFIQGAMSPGLEAGEILTRIEMDAWPQGHAFAFLEHARRAGDYAMSSAACLLTFDAQGAIARAAICVGGLGDRPARLPHAEQSLLGARPDEQLFAQVAQEVERLPAEGGIHASAPFKRQIARTLVRRALTSACATMVMA